MWIVFEHVTSLKCLGPFQTWAKGCDHVIARALDSYPKVVQWHDLLIICITPLGGGLGTESGGPWSIIYNLSCRKCMYTFHSGRFFWVLSLHLLVWMNGLGLFDQWEIIECIGHGSLVSCVKWPLGGHYRRLKISYDCHHFKFVGVVTSQFLSFLELQQHMKTPIQVIYARVILNKGYFTHKPKAVPMKWKGP